mmetsp:Transcript_39680/g.95447  ORF Transcript_39680/g.95447 Transcript_39680/m.95447 type:complete len:255 (+) Transcript_39680:226-990(+)
MGRAGHRAFRGYTIESRGVVLALWLAVLRRHESLQIRKRRFGRTIIPSRVKYGTSQGIDGPSRHARRRRVRSGGIDTVHRGARSRGSGLDPLRRGLQPLHPPDRDRHPSLPRSIPPRRSPPVRDNLPRRTVLQDRIRSRTPHGRHAVRTGVAGRVRLVQDRRELRSNHEAGRGRRRTGIRSNFMGVRGGGLRHGGGGDERVLPPGEGRWEEGAGHASVGSGGYSAGSDEEEHFGSGEGVGRVRRRGAPDNHAGN